MNELKYIETQLQEAWDKAVQTKYKSDQYIDAWRQVQRISHVRKIQLELLRLRVSK